METLIHPFIHILSLFVLKHFVVDFLLQNKFQLNNKGDYLHFGGILHSLLHGIATAAIVYYMTYKVFIFAFDLAVVLGFIDYVIHYHIDWAKVNINKKFNFHPGTSEFWVLLGLDQFLHYFTYILIILLVFSGHYDWMVEISTIVIYLIGLSLFLSVIDLMACKTDDYYRNKKSSISENKI